MSNPVSSGSKTLTNLPMQQSAVAGMLTPLALSKILENSQYIRHFILEDIKPQFQEIIIEGGKQVQIDGMFKVYINYTLVKLGICVSDPQVIEDFLNSKENAPYLDDIKSQITKIANVAVEKFKMGGVPISILNDKKSKAQIVLNLQLLPNFLKKESKEVSIHYRSFDKISESRKVSLLFEKNVAVEKKEERQLSILSKQTLKKKEVTKIKTEQFIESVKNTFDYYLFLSSKLNKDLDKIELEEIDLKQNVKDFEVFLEKKRVQIEKKQWLDIENSFELCERKTENVKTKGKKKSHSAKQVKAPKEESVTVSKTKKEVVPEVKTSILFGKIEFFLDKRITRWFHSSSEGIRAFEDKVGSVKVRHYKDLDPKQLEEQRFFHRLPGVERLLSLSPENLQKYSRPYQFIHPIDGSVKKGRCFSIQFKHGDRVEKGMIYVGVDGKKIYHAQFVSFFKIVSTTTGIKNTDMCLTLDGLDSQTDEVDDWEMQSGYTFNVEEDETIVWKIADGNSEVEFQIQSLF